uniref:selenoprotein S-like n=1 Tax=Styela clava TaxID=7725 RepID=UPI00193A4A12|nr:selenoprotein S-like [Styela clava]
MAAEVDDATVEVEDEFVEEQIDLKNINPNVMMASYYAVTSFLATYGWTLMVIAVLLIIIWSNIEKKVKKMIERAKERNDPVENDPEVLAKRAEAMELARQRMQEKASAILRREAERRQELEEKKRLEKLEDYDAMQAGKSSHATQRKVEQNDKIQAANATAKKLGSKDKAKPLRDNDYNPLTGTSSSTRYRPPPRRTGGG